MEFHEKLQTLRKQHHWTQEQLAEQLFVSRTAISKWESGKGYPNIDSLKALSAVFGVSIDELLSGEELITVAEAETAAVHNKGRATFLAALDLAALAFVFLPLYGKTIDGYIYSATLWAPPDCILPVRLCYWGLALALIVLGLMALVALRRDNSALATRCQRPSLLINILATPFFIATQEPYAATLMFIILLVKGALLLHHHPSKEDSHDI